MYFSCSSLNNSLAFLSVDGWMYRKLNGDEVQWRPRWLLYELNWLVRIVWFMRLFWNDYISTSKTHPTKLDSPLPHTLTWLFIWLRQDFIEKVYILFVSILILMHINGICLFYSILFRFHWELRASSIRFQIISSSSSNFDIP